MNHGVQLAKGYNLFLMVMLAVQFVILVGIIIALAYLGTGSIISIITVVSVVSLVVLCLPLAILQYLSSRDRVLKILFAGQAIVFLLGLVSVFFWYLAPELPGLPWLLDFAKFLTLLTYVPMLLSLLAASKASDFKREPYTKAAILFLSAVSGLTVLVVATVGFGRAGADLFSTLNYTGSVIFDIAVLALTSMLILTHLPGKLRYLLSIIMITYMFSTVADVLMLMDGLRLLAAFDLASLGYALMINFTGLALLAYSLGNIKVVTVEEVSRKLDDVTLLMSDLVEQSPLAICMCDTAGTIVTANDRFLEICGLRRPEVTGKLGILQALPEAGVALPSLAAQAAGIDTATVDGLRVERAGKAPAYFRLKVFPTRGSEGLVSHIVVILDDVTERKAFEDQLVCAKKQTDLYVDLMGHDVNNMNQIAMGFLELAEEKIRQDGQLRKDDLFLISKPIEALTHNSRIIYNIRKLQQEKAGAYQHEPVDVGRVLAGLASRYSGIAGRDVRVSLRTGENCTVMANELLGEVFDNLVGNAVKHTDGPVCIEVTMAKIKAEGLDCCRVTVEDNGHGIADEMKGKLFDRLALDCKRASGSGFGLCLSKILVEDFGGRLEVEDRVPGDYTKGARFVVTLPLIEAS
ncbi:PAS domain-containing sensor histidine kinase [Methanocella sp. MCL-LM]|uniref:PAS domain-containing sensor histidine kinase n=1 Tax=Methanocella sp. MCL-LM TaxID=3412035 RepID=UPI003C70B17C